MGKIVVSLSFSRSPLPAVLSFFFRDGGRELKSQMKTRAAAAAVSSLNLSLGARFSTSDCAFPAGLGS